MEAESYGVICFLSFQEVWKKDCHNESQCTCDHNTTLAGISQMTVYLNCAPEAVHCSTVIMNMVSLTTCLPQNRNRFLGCLDKEKPEIILMSLFLSMCDGKNLKNSHIFSVKECRRKMLILGTKWKSQPKSRKFVAQMGNKEGSQTVGRQTCFLGGILTFFQRRDQNKKVKLQPVQFAASEDRGCLLPTGQCDETSKKEVENKVLLNAMKHSQLLLTPRCHLEKKSVALKRS